MALERSSDKQLVESVESARRRTRSVLSTNWFPMILFGLLALVSVAVYQVWSWRAMAALWVVGAPIAGLATGFWDRRRGKEVGRPGHPRSDTVTLLRVFRGPLALGIAGR